MSTPAAVNTARKKAGALIFLHGLGDGPSGWSWLQDELPTMKPRLAQIEYVFPQSPEVPISINGGMRMPGWFDIFEWPISVGDPDDKPGKLKAVEQMEKEIHKLTEQGIPRNKIVIGGFSQGGAIALLTAYYSNPPTYAARPPLAGCATLSGWLTLTKEIKVANPQTPLFWGHGQFDDKVLFPQQAAGISQLSSAGVENLEFPSYPMGHQSCPEELTQFAEFLDSVIFRDESTASPSTAKKQEL